VTVHNESLESPLLLYIAAAVGACILVALSVLTLMRLVDDGRVNAIWRSLRREPSGRVFSEAMLADLPAPAERYLRHAIRPSTPLASSVQLRMTGKIRSNPDADWTHLSAEEILSVPDGFVWKAKIRQGYERLSGADRYAGGAGCVRFWLWGIIPVLHQEGPDTSKSATGRVAIESIWLPSSLLPQAGAEWEAIDNQSAKATLRIGGEITTLTLLVAPDGRLRRSVISRWGEGAAQGEPAYIPFTAEVIEERTFGGYTIPSRIVAGWWIHSDRFFEFFQATIEEAEYR